MSSSPSKAYSKAQGVLNGVYFFLNDSLTPAVREKLQQQLVLAGAKPCRIPVRTNLAIPPIRFDIKQLTHVITDTLDFPEYTSMNLAVEVEAGRIAVVLPSWATRSIDSGTVADTRQYSPEYSRIFAGAFICTSGLPDLDNQAIQAGVESLGGAWRRELTKEVTHLISLTSSGPKYDAWSVYGEPSGMLCILPDWFDECIRLRQLVPTAPFQFPDPLFASTKAWGGSDAFVKRSAKGLPAAQDKSPSDVTRDILGSLSHNSEAQHAHNRIYMETSLVTLDQGDYGDSNLKAGFAARGLSNRPQPNEIQVGHATAKIFEGRCVYLASDLCLRNGLERTLKERIIEAGGECWSFGVDNMAEKSKGASSDAWHRRRVADTQLRKSCTVVTRLREGWEYWHAYEQEKQIGNLAWLYHVLATSKLDAPLDRLLHYPLPPTPISGFEKLEITISNYNGSSRDYVRTMIELMGAKFSGSMSKTTTHVITASHDGTKVKHAKMWGIPLVNHLWLDACFMSWSELDISHSDTFTTPTVPGVYFMALIGRTALTLEMVKNWAELPSVKADKDAALLAWDEANRMVDDEVSATESAQMDEGEKFEEIGGDEGSIGDESSRTIERNGDMEVVQQLELEAEEEEECVAEAEAEVEMNEAEEPEEREEEQEDEEMEGDQQKLTQQSDQVKEELGHHREPSPFNSPRKDVSTPKVRIVMGSLQTPIVSVSKSTPASTSNHGIDTGRILPVGGKRKAAGGAAEALRLQMADKNQFEREQKGSSKKKRKVEVVQVEDRDTIRDMRENLVERMKGKGKQAKERKGSQDSDGTEIAREKLKRANKKVVAPRVDKSVVNRTSAVENVPTGGTTMSSFDRSLHVKIPKVKLVSAPKIQFLNTGVGAELDSDQISAMELLGSKSVDQPSKSLNVLIAAGIFRTEKFLCALGYGPVIVTRDWVIDSISQHKILDTEPYRLRDHEREKLLHMSLEESLNRARTAKVFEDLTFYITPKCQPSREALQRIIKANGGVANFKFPSHRDLLDQPQRFVISSIGDRPLWEKLSTTTLPKVPIYSVEAILMSVLRQKLDFTPDSIHRCDAKM